MSAEGFDPHKPAHDRTEMRGKESLAGKQGPFPPRAIGRTSLFFDDGLMACEACGSAEFRPFASDWQGAKIVSCRSCGLRFVNPRPSFESLARAGWGEGLSGTDRSLQRAPSGGQERALVEWRQRQYRSQIEQLEARVPPGPHSLLDVDCGDGAFLQYAADRGWHVFGTNPAEGDGIQRLRARPGFHAYLGRLHEIDFRAPDAVQRRFSAVRLHHVLERSHHPARDLQVCRRILQPNGILLLSVPNVASLEHRLKSLTSRLRLKARPWKHYAALQHFFFFTADTLERLLDRCGFEILHWQTPVLQKVGRSEARHEVHRALLEFPRWASTLEVYARLA